jgi:hypothetical protein
VVFLFGGKARERRYGMKRLFKMLFVVGVIVSFAVTVNSEPPSHAKKSKGSKVFKVYDGDGAEIGYFAGTSAYWAQTDMGFTGEHKWTILTDGGYIFIVDTKTGRSYQNHARQAVFKSEDCTGDEYIYDTLNLRGHIFALDPDSGTNLYYISWDSVAESYDVSSNPSSHKDYDTEVCNPDMEGTYDLHPALLNDPLVTGLDVVYPLVLPLTISPVTE